MGGRKLPAVDPRALQRVTFRRYVERVTAELLPHMSDKSKAPGSESDALSQLETANAQLSTLRTEISNLTSERDRLKGDLGNANSQVTALTGQVTALTTERDGLKSANTTLTGQVTDLTTERDTLKAERTTVTAELAKHGILRDSVPAGAKSKETAASEKDAALIAEYESVKNDPIKLAALLGDKVKGPALRALVA